MKKKPSRDREGQVILSVNKFSRQISRQQKIMWRKSSSQQIDVFVDLKK
jgi:hypothetical protein